MPAKCGTKSGQIEDLPRYIRLALGLDLEWKVKGLCRHDNGDTNIAWRVAPSDRVDVGGSRYVGAELIAYAEAVCELCPAQWSCARYALESEALFGTWGMDYEKLEWLRRQGNSLAVIDAADAEDVPVQVAVNRLRRAVIPAA